MTTLDKIHTFNNRKFNIQLELSDFSHKITIYDTQGSFSRTLEVLNSDDFKFLESIASCIKEAEDFVNSNAKPPSPTKSIIPLLKSLGFQEKI